MGGRALEMVTKDTWPSGLRRQLKALVRKGVGSNPTVFILFCANFTILFESNTSAAQIIDDQHTVILVNIFN